MFRISTAFIIGVAIVGAAWVLVGVAMVCFGSSRILAGTGSQRWPHVQGYITRSELHPVKNSSGETAFYHINVAYTYSLPGEPYASDNNRLSMRGFIDPADNSYSLAEARRFTHRLPVGRAVTVYYKPGSSSVSTLRPGTDIGMWSGSIMGLISLLLGALILRFMALVGSGSKPKAVAA